MAGVSPEAAGERRALAAGGEFGKEVGPRGEGRWLWWWVRGWWG